MVVNGNELSYSFSSWFSSQSVAFILSQKAIPIPASPVWASTIEIVVTLRSLWPHLALVLARKRGARKLKFVHDANI